MQIGIVHNFYQWRGGEDSVFEAEVKLLASHGVTVKTFSVHNRSIDTFAAKLAAFFSATWSWKYFFAIRKFIKTENISVLHVHNTFPLLSPSIYWAAKSKAVPVVFTVHNYRLGCLNAQFLRQNAVCLKCAGRVFKFWGVRYRCYRGSLLASLAIFIATAFHRLLGTWKHAVDVYIALTPFAQEFLARENIAPEKILVKGNFVFPKKPPAPVAKDYFLFMGRHSEEKGIDVLIKAWSMLDPTIEVRVLGEGPLTETLKSRAKDRKNIHFLGHVDSATRDQLLSEARAVVFPSVWFEGFPMVIAEALSLGVPVVASRLGAMQSVLRHEKDALLFSPGKPDALAQAIMRLQIEPGLWAKLQAGARARAHDSFNVEDNFLQMMRIYKNLTEHAKT